MPLNDIVPYDFAWMRQGIHLATPSQHDIALTQTQTITKGSKKITALLMLHGFSSSPAVFRLIAPKLQHYDHIFVPTLAGHGQSIARFAKSSAKSWLQDAESAYHILHSQFESVDVLGLSLGGLMACHLAEKHPIRNLFLLAPALALKNNLSQLRLIASICKQLGFVNVLNRGGRTFDAVVDELLYRQLPLETIIEILNFIDNYELKSWNTATYLFLGQHDDVVDSKQVHHMLKQLPILQVSYLPNSNHVLPIDGDYEQIIEHINLYSSK